MAIININNKVALNDNPNVPDINKVKDSDINLFKQVCNQIITTLGLYVDDWSSSSTYSVGDIVIDDNRLFINLTGTNTTTEPKNDSTNWQELYLINNGSINKNLVKSLINNSNSNADDETYSCDFINKKIVEYGTANNGTYAKYIDGTLICHGSAGPITTNAGTGTDITITLPYNFKNRWFDVSTQIVDGQAYWGQMQTSITTLSGSQFKLTTWNNSGGINANQYFSYIAIGRWK